MTNIAGCDDDADFLAELEELLADMPDHDFSAVERRAGDSGGASGSAMPAEDRPLFLYSRLDVN